MVSREPGALRQKHVVLDPLSSLTPLYKQLHRPDSVDNTIGSWPSRLFRFAAFARQIVAHTHASTIQYAKKKNVLEDREYRDWPD